MQQDDFLRTEIFSFKNVKDYWIMSVFLPYWKGLATATVWAMDIAMVVSMDMFHAIQLVYNIII